MGLGCKRKPEGDLRRHSRFVAERFKEFGRIPKMARHRSVAGTATTPKCLFDSHEFAYQQACWVGRPRAILISLGLQTGVPVNVGKEIGWWDVLWVYKGDGGREHDAISEDAAENLHHTLHKLQGGTA